MPPPPLLPAETSVGSVSLRVKDPDSVSAFYRNAIGLEVRETRESTTVLGTTDADLLALIHAPTAPARTDTEAGLFHTAFRVPSRAALGAALDRIREHARLDGASDHLVSEALYLQDPAGNGVEVYADRPRDEWPREPDGGIDMQTRPLDLSRLPRPDAPRDTAPPGTDVGHVHLEATDLDRAEAFYVHDLGLNVRSRYGTDAVFVAAGDYHHHIGLNTWNHRTQPPTGLGLAWYELVAPQGTEPQALAAALRERGHDPALHDDHVTATDPSGITLRITN